MEIFDRDKKTWYIIERSKWTKRLVLRERKYTNITKFPKDGDLLFSDCFGTIIYRDTPYLYPSENFLESLVKNKGG